MPKGNYDSSVTYEMLDLVSHNGKVWLAKKTALGIEPSITNVEYWMDVIDLTQVNLDEAGILSNKGGRESTIKGTQLFLANGRCRLYHPELPNAAGVMIQANESETEMDKNSSAYDIRRDMPLETRYGLLEHDSDGNLKRYAIYGSHNKPNANDIVGLEEFVRNIIANN